MYDLTSEEMKIAHDVLDLLGLKNLDEYTIGFQRGYKVGYATAEKEAIDTLVKALKLSISISITKQR